MARDYGDLDGWIEYIPEYDGNREDFESGKDLNPITAEIRPMSVRENQRQAANVRAKPGGGGIRTNQVEIRQETFRSHVRNIQNLKVGGKPVTTPDELLNTKLHELVAEIEDAITNNSRLSEGEIKNCRSRSAGAGKESGTA